MRIKSLLRIAIILLTVGALIFLGWQLFSNWPEVQDFFIIEKAQEPEKTNKVPLAADGAVLYERFEASQQYLPTPEEIAEDQAFEAEQIEQARQWLQDIDSNQRIAGIEQLAAYPSTRAEQLMVDILKKDQSEEVRVAAAVNLSYMLEPSAETQDALVSALQDANEDVRNGALNTLQSYVSSAEEGGATVKRIVGLLKRRMASKEVPSDTRVAIKDYLDDQFGN